MLINISVTLLCLIVLVAVECEGLTPEARHIRDEIKRLGISIRHRSYVKVLPNEDVEDKPVKIRIRTDIVPEVKVSESFGDAFDDAGGSSSSGWQYGARNGIHIEPASGYHSHRGRRKKRSPDSFYDSSSLSRSVLSDHWSSGEDFEVRPKSHRTRRISDDEWVSGSRESGHIYSRGHQPRRGRVLHSAVKTHHSVSRSHLDPDIYSAHGIDAAHLPPNVRLPGRGRGGPYGIGGGVGNSYAPYPGPLHTLEAQFSIYGGRNNPVILVDEPVVLIMDDATESASENSSGGTTEAGGGGGGDGGTPAAGSTPAAAGTTAAR